MDDKLKFHQKIFECKLILKTCISIIEGIDRNNSLSKEEKIFQLKEINAQIEKVSNEIDILKAGLKLFDTTDNN